MNNLSNSIIKESAIPQKITIPNEGDLTITKEANIQNSDEVIYNPLGHISNLIGKEPFHIRLQRAVTQPELLKRLICDIKGDYSLAEEEIIPIALELGYRTTQLKRVIESILSARTPSEGLNRIRLTLSRTEENSSEQTEAVAPVVIPKLPTIDQRAHHMIESNNIHFLVSGNFNQTNVNTLSQYMLYDRFKTTDNSANLAKRFFAINTKPINYNEGVSQICEQISNPELKVSQLALTTAITILDTAKKNGIFC